MSESAIHIEVLCWGPAQDLAGVASLSLAVPIGATLAQLRNVICERCSQLSSAMSVIKMAVNESFVNDDFVLSDGDVVALIPPVSGGAPSETVWVDLVKELISLERVRAFVSGDAVNGAIVTFEGATRCDTDPQHGRLIELRYEAYDSMARKQMVLLANEAKDSYELGRVAILHRIGSVPLAQVSVAIAVAAPHRSAAFEGCRQLIDRLKQDVPIWKKDVFADGFVRWVDPSKANSDHGV